MKIKKSQLLRLVKEETLKRLGKLVKEDSTSVVDADSDNKEKDKKKKPSEKPKAADKKDDKKSKSPEKKSEKDKELPGVSPEQDVEADSAGHGIGDQISGLTVISFTMAPRSKLVPGAIELNMQFKENSQPLRIFLTKTGQVRFLYKGSIQSDLGSNPTPELPSAADNQPLSGGVGEV